MENLFPNAHGIKLWAIVFAALITAACIGAFMHSLYELWVSQRPKKQVFHLDEFEDRDDPFAELHHSTEYDEDLEFGGSTDLPAKWITKHINWPSKVVSVTFHSAVELAVWINGNILDELKQERLMFMGINNKKVYGAYELNFVATDEELQWMS